MKNYFELDQHLKQNRYRWLVTGAAGFIGSNLCLKLLELGQHVVGFDNYFTGQKKNIDELNTTHSQSGLWQFIEGNICDRETLNLALDSVDFVSHQAAVGSVPRSIQDPITSHQNNVNGFLNLIDLVRNHRVKKVVFASSSSVYGDSPTLPKTESVIGSPLSPYAVTKRINELYANVFARCYNSPLVGLRYFNVFGPRQDPSGPYAAVVPLWIESLLNGEPVYINGDGSFSRDFCYVDNVIQANLMAAFSAELTNGQVYNIAFGDRTDLRQLYSILQNSLRQLKKDFVLRDPIFRDSRLGDIPHSHADISRAKNDFHFDPQISAEQGLHLTVAHYLKNFEKEN